MKLKTDDRFKHFECSEQIQMGLDLENSHSIMSLLRNNIYSNPIQSWVREIYSNAVDAHARVNNTKDAIDITIEPKDHHYMFIVRDYGASMNKDQIANIYTKMGKSDKKQGNTEMGGWGLGAKSPLAYTDHFWIETYTVEDECNIYRKWVQYIDSTRVGALGLQEEKIINGNFKTGTRVTIPFDKKDYESVKTNILLYLSYTQAKFSLQGIDYKYTRPKYKFYGDGWALSQHKDYYWAHSEPNKRDDGIAVIGNIPYRIDFKALYQFFKSNDVHYCTKDLMPKNPTIEADRDFFNKFLIALRVYSFQIDLPIGAVDLSASREDLQYTRQTCVSLYKYFFKLFVGFCKDIKLNLIYRRYLPEACIRFEEDYGGYMREVVLSNLLWYREPIKFSSEPAIFTQPAVARRYKLDQTYGERVKTVLKSFETSKLDLGSSRKYYLIKQDTDYVNYSKFIKFYLIENNYEFNDYMLVVDSKDFHILADWVKETLDIFNMSDLVAFYKENYTRSTKTNRADKANFKTFSYCKGVERERADGLGRYFSEVELPIEPDEEYYYIDANQYREFEYRFAGYDSYLCSALTSFLESRNIPPSNLVYTKKVTRNYKHDNWINFLDLIKDEYQTYQSEISKFIAAKFTQVVAIKQYPIVADVNQRLIKHPQGLFQSVVDMYKDAVKHVDDNQQIETLLTLVTSEGRKLADDIKGYWYKNYNPKLIKSSFEDYVSVLIPIQEAFDSFFVQYPMLQIYNKRYYDNRDMVFTIKDFTKYIALMEKDLGHDCIEKEESTDSSFSFKQLMDRFISEDL